MASKQPAVVVAQLHNPLLAPQPHVGQQEPHLHVPVIDLNLDAEVQAPVPSHDVEPTIVNLSMLLAYTLPYDAYCHHL